MQLVQGRSTMGEPVLYPHARVTVKQDIYDHRRANVDSAKNFIEKEASKMFKMYITSKDPTYYRAYEILTQLRWRTRE